jgi:hypothetical protein
VRTGDRLNPQLVLLAVRLPNKLDETSVGEREQVCRERPRFQVLDGPVGWVEDPPAAILAAALSCVASVGNR